ncbi:MAG: hypothetical protein QOG82_1233 [Actinomycetota bacterium]|jgi:hypothetical protein|nr:hypothetical protein [Actinomycetota bacterium]
MGALVIVAAFGGVACGDDDDETAAPPTTAKADFTAYCEASFDLETYFAQDPDVDFETATPEQIQAALATYLQGAKPLVDTVIPLAPPAIKADLDVQVAAFNQALGGADPEQAFETPAVNAAEARTHGFDVDNCGWNQVKVTATEYAYAGLPATLEAGRTSIDLTNNGKELHEVVLLTKNPGVTETWDQILALPEEEGMTKATPQSFTFAAQGDTEYSVVDLAAGDYVAVCFIPQGLTSEDGPPPADDAKPHFALGMKKEITVA